MQHHLLKLSFLTLIVLFASCRTPEVQGGTKWNGIFHLPKGDQKAEASLNFEEGSGILSLPDLIPVPLYLEDVRKAADSVFFTINFRSGPAPCKALIKGDTMRGTMISRGTVMAFWMAKTGEATANTFNQPKPPANMPMVINTTTGTNGEIETKARLEALLGKYNLEPYLYTKEVRIAHGTIPHSHPVLTLNTRFEGNDTYLLSTFLHEQMHWYTLSKDYDNEALGKTLFEMYPEVPIDLPEGAGSQMGTYLHLLVCYLEYHVLEQVIGTEAAMAHMKFMTSQHYTWVYKTIVKDKDQLDQLIREYNLQFD